MEHLSDHPVPDHGSVDFCETRHYRHVERSPARGQMIIASLKTP